MSNLNPWVRCPDCQKIHVLAGISQTSVCSCGRSLWPVAFPQVRPGLDGGRTP